MVWVKFVKITILSFIFIERRDSLAIEQKRFPANTTLNELTFLNDKKINGELYALLQGLSCYEVIDKETNKFLTYVSKSAVPKQSIMCETLGIKSPKTLRNHLNYLIESGYVQDRQDKYILPEMENIYFLIPLKTLKYLNDNCKEHVIKIYVYLGQRYKWALDKGIAYEFTLEELGNHIGIKVKNNSRGYEIINNALELLSNSGLIDYVSFFDGQMQKKKLTKFSYEYTMKD